MNTFGKLALPSRTLKEVKEFSMYFLKAYYMEQSGLQAHLLTKKCSFS